MAEAQKVDIKNTSSHGGDLECRRNKKRRKKDPFAEEKSRTPHPEMYIFKDGLRYFPPFFWFAFVIWNKVDIPYLNNDDFFDITDLRTKVCPPASSLGMCAPTFLSIVLWQKSGGMGGNFWR